MRAREARQLRRRGEGSGLTTALPATFIGLLLVQALQPVEALARDGAPQPAAPDEPNHEGMVQNQQVVASNAAEASAMPASVVGSILSVGALIDPAALSQLSGGAHFGDSAPRGVPPSEAAASAQAADQATVDPGPAVEVTLGSVALPELPSLGTGTTGTEDENLGEIGDTDQAGPGGGTLTGTADNDTLLGAAGADVLQGLGGDDRLEGAGGNDRLEGGSGEDSLAGGEGSDELLGGDGDDRLDGGAGDDRLDGGGGDDRLQGGEGGDRLAGGGGTNILEGGAGDDVYHVDGPLDVALEDGGGNDTFEVGAGYAEAVQDVYRGQAPDGRTTFVLGRVDGAEFPGDVAAFRQQIHPEIENITLDGDAGHDVVADAGASRILGDQGGNHLYAGAGDDWAEGRGEDDTLYGQEGADHLDGGTGSDVLYGGDGDDWLAGGAGDDLLYGGGGDDVFMLGLHEGTDTVFDHEGSNTLRLEGVDPALVTATQEGGDLVIANEGSAIARIGGWAEHQDAFAGIDLGQGVRPLGDFLQGGQPAAQTLTAQDWLADFFDPGSAGSTQVASRSAAGTGAAAADVASADAGFAIPEMAHGFVAETDAPASERHEQRS